MANDTLRRAMAGASMSVRDLAARVGVDEKTVSRWVSDPARVPHPRHRDAAATVLGVEEEMLWPEAVRQSIKTGPDREVVAVYPYRSLVPKTLWRGLVTGATKRLVFAGYTNYFLWLEIPGFRDVVGRKAEQGIDVRFLVGDPDSDVTRHREAVEDVALTVSTRIKVTLDELRKLRQAAVSVQARFSDGHIALSVFTFDDEALVCTHIADRLGHDSPTLHLRRHQNDGLFDRYAGHVDYLWNLGQDVAEAPHGSKPSASPKI
jgi:transcriptional regulator with XRE-family HTH domain